MSLFVNPESVEFALLKASHNVYEPLDAEGLATKVDEAGRKATSLSLQIPAKLKKEAFSEAYQTSHKRYKVALDSLRGFQLGGRGLDELHRVITNNALEEIFTLLMTNVENKGGDYTTAKKEYDQFLLFLRRAIETIGTEDPNSLDYRIVNKLSFDHFNIDISLSDVGIPFIKGLLGEDLSSQFDDLSAEELERSIKEALPKKSFSHYLLGKSRQISATAPWALDWDPASYSIRSKLIDLRVGDKDITLVRTACPVVGKSSNPKVDPIFIAMLRYLKLQGKQYIYVNNQSLDPSSDHRPIENKLESQRVCLMFELSNSEEFKEMFHVVSFAHDSDFYKQEEGLNAANFISQFRAHLWEGKQGYQLPHEIKVDSKNEAKIHQLLVKIHEHYFGGEGVLTQEERRLFLHISYAAITELLTQDLKIDFMNVACKDAVDRAAGSVVNLVRFVDPKFSKEKMMWLLTFPAVLNHSRAPKRSRHGISIKTLKKIASKEKMPKVDYVPDYKISVGELSLKEGWQEVDFGKPVTEIELDLD